jgi:group I intron endonuclease
MEFRYDGNSLKGGVYKLTNTTNGKFYVGSTYQFKRRWYQHHKQLETKKHTNTYLQNAFNQDGTDAFVFEVLEVITASTSKEEAKQVRLNREQTYLDLWFDKQQQCYNLGSWAQSREGKKSTTPEATSKLISQKMKEVWKDPAKNAKRLATISSPEYKLSQSQKMKEKWEDLEYQETQSQKLLEAEKVSQSSSKRMLSKWNQDELFQQKMSVLGTQSMTTLRASASTQAKRKENAKRACQERLAKNYGFIKSPSGEIFEVINISQFTRTHNLERRLLSYVFEGKRNHHKGWMKP